MVVYCALLLWIVFIEEKITSLFLGGGFAGSYEIHCDTVASDTLL